MRVRQRHLLRGDALRRACADLRCRVGRRRRSSTLLMRGGSQGLRSLLLALPFRPHHGPAVPEAALRARGHARASMPGISRTRRPAARWRSGFMSAALFPGDAEACSDADDRVSRFPPARDVLSPHPGISHLDDAAQPSERLRRLPRGLCRASGLLHHRHRACAGRARCGRWSKAIRGADIMIYDCMYTDAEFERYRRLRPFHLGARRAALRGGRREAPGDLPPPARPRRRAICATSRRRRRPAFPARSSPAPGLELQP